MACVLNQDIPLRNIFRGLMFLPWAVPAVVTAYVWRFLFDTTGPINGAIANFGLAGRLPLLLQRRQAWRCRRWSWWSIWAGTPFWTMNLLAGHAAISQELYEAAEIDGAGTCADASWYITLPSLQPVIVRDGAALDDLDLGQPDARSSC